METEAHRALFEAAQRYLPGRIPEATDTLLAVIAAFVISLVEGPISRARSLSR